MSEQQQQQQEDQPSVTTAGSGTSSSSSIPIDSGNNDLSCPQEEERHVVEEEEIVNNYSSLSTKQEHARYLYSSFFFAAWGDRMWEFAGIVFLMEIFPTTLLPSSLFGFFETVAGIVSGSPIGKFIDTEDRLKVLRTSVVGQNLTIFVAGLIFAITLNHRATITEGQKWFAVVLIILAGMAARVSSGLNKISIHKDWSVVVAGGDSSFQTELNSNMRRVDLICSLLAPLMVGVLAMFYGAAVTCEVISLWSAVSLGVEWYVAGYVYERVAPLRVPKKKDEEEKEGAYAADDKKSNWIQAWFSEQKRNISEYKSHKVFGISLPYCFLYMSVLSFHGTMVSFLRTLGWSEVALACGRGIAAVVAIGSTVAVPKMKTKYGLKKTGLITLWSQVICLFPLAVGFGFVATTVSQQKELSFSVVIFVTLCLSRFGLWGFDLVEVQLMQELVAPGKAGVINGAQEAVVNFCWLLSFGTTMLWDDPKDFSKPVVISFGALLFAGFLFTRSYQDDPTNPVQLQEQTTENTSIDEPSSSSMDKISQRPADVDREGKADSLRRTVG